MRLAFVVLSETSQQPLDVKTGSDIRVALRMNCNQFDHLAFYLAPSGQSFELFNTFMTSKTNDIPISLSCSCYLAFAY